MKNIAFKCTVILFLTVYCFSCQNETKTEDDKPTTDQQMQQNLYTYADGSGNLYTISPDKIKYDPVTVVNSSSGTYSGGDPVDKALDKKDYEAIQTLLENALSNKAAHIEKRLKGSGVIVVFRPGESRVKCILDYSNTSKQELETALKKLIE